MFSFLLGFSKYKKVFGDYRNSIEQKFSKIPKLSILYQKCCVLGLSLVGAIVCLLEILKWFMNINYFIFFIGLFVILSARSMSFINERINKQIFGRSNLGVLPVYIILLRTLGLIMVFLSVFNFNNESIISYSAIRSSIMISAVIAMGTSILQISLEKKAVEKSFQSNGIIKTKIVFMIVFLIHILIFTSTAFWRFN